MATGKPELAAEHPQELTAVTVAVAEALRAEAEREHERQQEAHEAEPGKEDIEKARCKEEQRIQPEVVIPVALCRPHAFHGRTSIKITPAGHTRLHMPQPTHRLSSTTA